MIIAICIKITFILIGLLVAILSIASLKKRITTPSFTVIWIISGIILILTGIFIEPYDWSKIIGVPTIIFFGILTGSIVALFWNLTKKIDDIQHKFDESVIQLTLLKDENNEIKNELQSIKHQIEINQENSLKLFNKTQYLSDTKISNKKVLFVNNTLSTGGAEKQLLEVLELFVKRNNDVYLYIMTEMSELINKLPNGVCLLNENFDSESVLTKTGKNQLKRKVLLSETKKFTWLKLFPYTIKAFINMANKGKIHYEKLAWRAIAESSPKIKMHFDLAIAFTEGASTYYVANSIIADKKIAYVHTDYEKSGYTQHLDKNDYDAYNEIITVSEYAKKTFLNVHPECSNKIRWNSYSVDKDKIYNLAQENINEFPIWMEKQTYLKIITVSRLIWLKSINLIIETADILNKLNINFKWIILGEGEDRTTLEKEIKKKKLSEKVLLLGSVENPYKYMVNSDIFVHVSAFEGRSIAVQEAIALNCNIVLSNTKENKDQVSNYKKSTLCSLNAHDIAMSILNMS